jgi:hypothetical protein
MKLDTTGSYRKAVLTAVVAAMLVLSGCGAFGGQGTPTAGPEPTATLTATETPTPEPTATATPTETDDPVSKIPTLTPRPEQAVLSPAASVSNESATQFERFARSVEEHYAGTVEAAHPASNTTGYLEFSYVTGADTSPASKSDLPAVSALAQATAETGGYPDVRFALQREDGDVALSFALNRSHLQGYAEYDVSRYQLSPVLSGSSRTAAGFASDDPRVPLYANETMDRVRHAWAKEIVDRLPDKYDDQFQGYRLTNESYVVEAGGANFTIEEGTTVTIRYLRTGEGVKALSYETFAETVTELEREGYWGGTNPGAFELEKEPGESYEYASGTTETYWPHGVVELAAEGDIETDYLSGISYVVGQERRLVNDPDGTPADGDWSAIDS